MFRSLVLVALAALASAQAPTCTQYAQSLYSCFSTTSYNGQGGGNGNQNPCCANVQAFTAACGPFDNLYNNGFFVNNMTISTQLAVNLIGCRHSDLGTCRNSSSAFVQCVGSSYLPQVSASVNIPVMATGGTFELDFQLPMAAATDPAFRVTIPFNATGDQIRSLIASSNPLFANLFVSINRVNYPPTTVPWSYVITFYANVSATGNNGQYGPVFANFSQLIPAPAGTGSFQTVPTSVVVAAPYTFGAPNGIACCSQAAQIQLDCMGFDFQNASDYALYAFASPVSGNSQLFTIASQIANGPTCPQLPQSMCNAATGQTYQCLQQAGFLSTSTTHSTYNPGPCCNWGTVGNYTCTQNVPPVSGYVATDAALVLQQFADCPANQHNGGGNGGNNNQCSNAVPNIFVYMNGTMPIPIIRGCTNSPSDPNYGIGGCTPVAQVNGQTYYVYYPLAGSGPGSSWYYNPGCVGL